MKAKVLVLGAILVALGAFATRLPRETSTGPRAPRTFGKTSRPDVSQYPELASYRVFEEPATEGSLPYRGANYKAEVGPDGLGFEAGGHRISLRSRRIEQGGRAVDLSAGEAKSTRFAAASVDRGQGVSEEFVFENRRAEHLVRVDRPLGDGAMTVRVAVETTLKGEVKQVKRGDATWKDMTLADGGLVFTDAAGKPGLAYHGAVAVDAQGRRQLFDPRWENGEIALEVPAAFLKTAAYPVLIDPWLELSFSGSGGGISLTGTVSENPAIALMGVSPCVAWADASDGDFDIYFRYWTGSSWASLGTSTAPGGISNNAGTSTNPSIGFATPTATSFFHPFIAWEDDGDSLGTINIYARLWTGSTWTALAGSSTSSGVSQSIGTPCRNPQAVGVAGLVDNDAAGTLPDRSETFPCIIWEEEGVGIASRFFYPGDNRLQAPVAGWYSHPSGHYIVQDPSAARPSVAIDGSNRVSVVWEASTGTEFDIFAARSTAAVQYRVDAITSVPQPSASVWGALDGGNVNAAVGATGGLSIQPSLAIDGNDEPWVAWQESVGVEREIYVAHLAVGNWTEEGNSASGFGVSGTTGTGSTSSFPSIAVDRLSATPQPIVAWEDDASGNPEIYVRRLNGAGTGWEQIADEGSAMLVLPELTGNNGGVSRTLSFSMRPKVVAAPDGTITVAWRDGSAGTFDLLVRRYHDNSPTSLAQAIADVSVFPIILTPLGVGGTSNLTSIQVSAVLVAESTSLPVNLHMQAEIRPSNTPFTGQATHDSDEVPSGGTATILYSGLPNVNYKWRVRTIDSSLGRTSPWISFGGNSDSAIDFRIDSSAAGAGGANTVTAATEKKDKCGLTGLEVFALLGLLAARRRFLKS